MAFEQTHAPAGPELVSVILFLLESALLAGCFSLMSKNLLPPPKSEPTRILTLVTTGISTVFTIVVGLVSIDLGMDTSDMACGTTYTLCVVFWLIVKTLVYLYFNEKLHLAKGTAAKSRTALKDTYLANILGLLLPLSFVLWILASFAHHSIKDGKCFIGLTSFVPLLYLFLHNLLLNSYLSLSFLRLPPPSLQEMLQANPAKYVWCNIATCIVPLVQLLMLLMNDYVEDGWIFVSAALLDVGIAVVILGSLEGWRDLRPDPPVEWEGQTCEDCDNFARNGESIGLNFFDLSLIESNREGDGKR